MSSQLFRKKIHQTSGSKTVIFFICPFGTKLWLVRPVIKKIQRAGYTVAAYDTTNEAFYAGNPDILIELVAAIAKDIGATMETLKQQGVEDFGFFGSSLGAFLAYNCVSYYPRQLRWGVFNTGGDLAEAMWRFKRARRAHTKKDITFEQLAKVWQGIGYPAFSNLHGNSYIFVSSPSDKITPLAGIHTCIDPAREAGAHTELVSVRAFGHSSTVVRGFKRSVELLERARAGVK